VLDLRHCEVLDDATRADVVQALAFDELLSAGSVPQIQRAVDRLRPVSTDRGSRVLFEEDGSRPNPGKGAQDAHARASNDMVGTADMADNDSARLRIETLRRRALASRSMPTELADSNHWVMPPNEGLDG